MSSFETWIKNTPFANKGLYGKDAPENSIVAVKKAIEKGYGVYLDARILADNTIVTFSDQALGRMTDRDGFIHHCTLNDLPELKLKDSDQTVPTLVEILDIIDGQVPVIVNLKSIDSFGMEKYVWKILQSYSGDYAVASANPYSLEWFKMNAPKVKRGQVSSFYKHSYLPLATKLAYKKMKLNDTVSEPNFIIYDSIDLPNRFVKKYKNLPLLANHVHDKQTLENAKKYACNFIFENIKLEIKQ